MRKYGKSLERQYHVLSSIDAFLGNFNSYSEASADPMGHFRFTQPEAFVQDSWKATRRA